jgi:hypothetical protein
MPRKKKSTGRPRLRAVRVEGQRRAEPDWDKYGWTLLQYAKVLQDEEKRKRRPSP